MQKLKIIWKSNKIRKGRIAPLCKKEQAVIRDLASRIVLIVWKTPIML